MARREAQPKDDDFLNRLFDEPADGESSESRPGQRSRPEDSRARLLAVLEAAGQRLEEGVVLDDALLAAYLDGVLASEEHIALEGLLARSADLRDQLAAAGEARAAALGGRVKMPKAFIEDFDAVPGPPASKPAPSPEATRSGALPRWLAAIVPGRRWAMAAVPVIVAVTVVAVIGPGPYRTSETPLPEAIASGVMADKEANGKATGRKPDSKFFKKEKKPQTRLAEKVKTKPRAGLSGAVRGNRSGGKDRVVARMIVVLDDDLRATLVRMGLRQMRPLAAAGSQIGRTAAKRQAAKPPAAKPSAMAAREQERGEAKAKPDRKKKLRRTMSAVPGSPPRNRPSAARTVAEKAIGKNCPGGAAVCCQRRRVDPKLLQRLMASGPPLQNMAVLRLSSKSCLFTLPGAAPRAGPEVDIRK